MYVYTYIHRYVCLYLLLCVQISCVITMSNKGIHTRIHTHACMPWANASSYIHTCIRTYIHTHTHACHGQMPMAIRTYIHTHTHAGHGQMLLPTRHGLAPLMAITPRLPHHISYGRFKATILHSDQKIRKITTHR